MELSSTLRLAMDHHVKGEKDLAVQTYKKFLEEGGKDKRVYTNLAAILRGEGNAEEALHFINLGLQEIDEKSPMLLNTLGNCLRDLNRNHEAITAYRKALKNHHGYFDPQISIVGILYEMGFKKLSDLCLMKLFSFYGVNKKQILHQIITREVENASRENRNIHRDLDIIIDLSLIHI